MPTLKRRAYGEPLPQINATDCAPSDWGVHHFSSFFLKRKRLYSPFPEAYQLLKKCVFRFVFRTRRRQPMKKVLIAFVILAMAGTANADLLLGWSFSGAAAIVSQVANDTIAANLDTGGIYNDLTRGAGAGTSSGASSFRTTGFQNNGINTANTDYFQFIISTSSGYSLSLSDISGAFAGTTSYSVSPGVSHQWAYSLDGSSFTLIDTAQSRIGNGTTLFDFTGVSALQNVTPETDVTLRYYATGQTSTGGWGFSSAGLDVNGSIVSSIPEPGVLALLSIGGLAILRFARRQKA
jgi:hypothetical protein